MSNKTSLDSYEQGIEDNFEYLQSVTNLEKEKAMLKDVATSHVKRKKSITIRISEIDLKAMQIKASKLGIPYQTYINMLIHKDAVSGF